MAGMLGHSEHCRALCPSCLCILQLHGSNALDDTGTSAHVFYRAQEAQKTIPEKKKYASLASQHVDWD